MMVTVYSNCYELKGFGTCVLFKNEMLPLDSFIYLLQVKEIGDSHPKLSPQREASPLLIYSIWLITCWFLLCSWLNLSSWFPIELVRLLVGVQNTVLHFNR